MKREEENRNKANNPYVQVNTFAHDGTYPHLFAQCFIFNDMEVKEKRILKIAHCVWRSNTFLNEPF